MKKLTTSRAQELKNMGYNYICSVVKRYKYTTYYNVNSIDDIIANGGKWIPAPEMCGCRWGITKKHMLSTYGDTVCGTHMI